MTPITQNILISETATLLDAITAIETGGYQIALVVNEDNKLLGTVTDGDVRRGLLHGVTLEGNVTKVMKVNPITLSKGYERQYAVAIMQQYLIHQIPVIDENGVIQGIELIDETKAPSGEFSDISVVLMAGGLGSRLRPLTETTPKPMLSIGGRPLIETIINKLGSQGLRNIYISVNYMADTFKNHFGNGQKHNVNITYLDEEKRMGTAGALTLMPERPKGPILVMNADILTSINYQQLIRFHKEHQNEATLCVREYNYVIPYGVVNTDGILLKSIEEKPTERHFISAGIYVLEPSALDHIPAEQFYDMPQLLNQILETEKNVSVFPIREYWLDIGHIDDLKRAHNEYDQVFDT